jgi:TonB family protein
MAKKDFSPLQGAYFLGGKAAMDEHIKTHLRYPQTAIEKKIEGTVHLFLDIDHKGNVTHVKVVAGIGHGCDEEAIRVVKLMKFQVEKVRNMHVVYHHKLQIHFRVPKQVAAVLPTELTSTTQENVSYNYILTPSKPKPVIKKEVKPKQNTNIYTYYV